MPSRTPTSDNARTVAGMYESFARGDVAAVLAKLDPDVEWIETEAHGVPARGSFRGPQEVLEGVFATVPKHFETFNLVPEYFVEAGDDVVVTGHLEARTLSGRDLRAPYAHVFSFGDGLVTRNENHHDTAVWLEVLGTAPSGVEGGQPVGLGS
jgi:ketosteroid isomerase-like protein